MKIRQIKASLAIVSTGGVRPAAKKLCLTPSTVAKSIGQLESDLGAPLFERSALSLRLNAADPPSSSSSRAAFSQTAELSALVEEPLFEVDHGIVAAPGHPVLAPDADLKSVFAQSEWLTTVQDVGFLLEKLGGLGISPERVTLCDFFGIDALKGRNDSTQAASTHFTLRSFRFLPSPSPSFTERRLSPRRPPTSCATRFAWPSRNGWPPSRAASFERVGDQHVHLCFLESIPPLKQFSKETGINSN